MKIHVDNVYTQCECVHFQIRPHFRKYFCLHSTLKRKELMVFTPLQRKLFPLGVVPF